MCLDEVKGHANTVKVICVTCKVLVQKRFLDCSSAGISAKMSEFSEDRSPVSDNAGMDISPGPPWKQGKPIVDSDDDEVAAAVGNLSISTFKKLQVCAQLSTVCVLLAVS